MKSNLLLILFFLLANAGCKDDLQSIIEKSDKSPNILLIIADDLGKDAITGYSEGHTKANTPTIDKISTSGIIFNNLWVYPTCSPTRASIITGKYGHRTGVKWAGDALADSEVLLQSYIKTQTENKYATAVIGKWHLAGEGNSGFNPETGGIDYYAGLLSGGVPNYSQWKFSEDGEQSTQSTYITEEFTDLAIDWVNSQNKPWFLWLAYTAPHTPFHSPPSTMHTQGTLADYSQGLNVAPYYNAAIEAMDYQIDRFLNSIPKDEVENTYVIFIGDNGTPNQAAKSPYARSTAKGTLFQGGINTPMFISGPGILSGQTNDNLISGTDLFATISELAGIDVPVINDSRSFRSLLNSPAAVFRNYIYSEMDNGKDDMWAIRNTRYKLITDSDGNKYFYDLYDDPYESSVIPETALSIEQVQALNELESELSLIRN